MQGLDELIKLVVKGDEEESVELAGKLIAEIEAPVIIDALTGAMRELGDKFEKKEIFLPALLVASDALLAVMGVVEPHLKSGIGLKKKTVVIGTVAGDMHEIGKSIVGIVLKANGFNVIDLGSDVSSEEFLEKAEEVNADIIGLSSLMTTSMFEQKKFIEFLKHENKRDKYKVIVGGAPISQKWANDIGADGYCEDAFKTVDFLNLL